MQQEPSESVQGRSIVSALIGAAITFELLAFIVNHLKQEPDGPIMQIVRCAILAGIIYALWRGAVWARWLLVALHTAGAVFLFVVLFKSYHVALLAMAVYLSVWTLILAGSSSIGEFQRYQRQKKQDRPNKAPLPTPGSVTPAADAPGAPPSSAPQL